MLHRARASWCSLAHGYTDQSRDMWYVAVFNEVSARSRSPTYILLTVTAQINPTHPTKSSIPMGNCFGKHTTLDTEATMSHHVTPVTKAIVPSRGSLQSGTIPPAQEVRKAISAPPAGQPTKRSAILLPLSPKRVRALSSVISSSSGLHPDIRPTCAGECNPFQHVYSSDSDRGTQ